jgi:CheY-like chemotaxis protein
MLLELLGHQVAVADTGPEGVRRAREWRPEVVLCDIGLPGHDGFAVAGELRHDPTTARAQLIAMTGYGQEIDRRRSQQAGFDLTRPSRSIPLFCSRCLSAPHDWRRNRAASYAVSLRWRALRGLSRYGRAARRASKPRVRTRLNLKTTEWDSKLPTLIVVTTYSFRKERGCYEECPSRGADRSGIEQIVHTG